MGKKKGGGGKAGGGKGAPPQEIPQEIEEEFVAIESIFAGDFSLHEDRLGFSLHIVPELGHARGVHGTKVSTTDD